MPNFIGLTTPDDERIMVNADHIATMTADDVGAFITLTTGGAIYVTESIYDIVEMTEEEILP